MELELSPTRQRRILVILVLSAVLIWLDTSILGIALERLADPVAGLGASPGQLQWAIGAYSLFFATGLFAAGALGDRYGHRSILVAGLAVFGAASLGAAVSGGAVALILARAVMGLGAAMIIPTSMALISWTFPASRRAAAIAVWSGSAGVGVAAGPLLGGLLLNNFWWGSVFLVNAPIVAVTLVAIIAFVPAPRSPLRRRLDPPGIALSTVGLLLFAYGLIDGGQGGGWGRWPVWGSIAAGLALLAAFVLVELRSRQPGFDPRLFRNFRFAAGNLAVGAMFLAITAQTLFANLYLQGALGWSALQCGLMFLPNALGVVLGAPLGARLVHRFGLLAVAGPALVAISLTFMAGLTFDLHPAVWWYLVVNAVQGLGIGAAVAPVTAAVLGALPADRAGAGSAVYNMIRQVGSVIGVAALGTVLASAYRAAITPTAAGLPEPARSALTTSAEAARHAAAELGRPALADAANQAYVHAMHVTVLWCAAIVLAGATTLYLAFRRPTAPTSPDLGVKPSNSTSSAPRSEKRQPTGTGAGAGGAGIVGG